MRFDNSRESSNVEDRRGGGGGGLPVGGRSIGLGTIVLALVAMYFGVDPSVVLNQTAVAPSRVEQARPAAAPAAQAWMSNERSSMASEHLLRGYDAAGARKQADDHVPGHHGRDQRPERARVA